MTDRVPPLTPYPLRVLLGRVAREWETRRRIFDLPTGRFYQHDPAHDLSFDMGGRCPSTPLGPAAGPHTQLAQNFVIGWLAGARVFEAKTVQILDELEIDRPCIDMEAEGYNIEWSQELTLDQSLEEYVKAWMMLDLLSRWEPLEPIIGTPGEHIVDLSIGYDLEGIQTERMDTFIRGMFDASEVIEHLRGQIPPPFAADHDFDPHIARSVTLSTFHGCPPDEIEGITRHLIDTYQLDVIVKLNPTLLGFEEVERLLHGVLGYTDVPLDRHAFDADLQFGRALQMIPDLQAYAAARGRRFGVKLSNTLVVGNHKHRMPGDVMYLSGRPLHVITVSLLDRLVDSLPGVLAVGSDPGPVQVSFSAGIEASNVADAAGLGLRPITVSSDLLKPGGYGHLSAMLKRLNQAMTDVAATTLDQWVEHREAEARSAGFRDAVAAYAARVTGPEGAAHYGAARVRTRLRHVDHTLELWGCVACNLCVTVCPNDAMLYLPTPDSLASELADRWQYFCLAELCNDCGNCATFCPEEGAPFQVKPRLYIDSDRFATPVGPAFLIGRDDGAFAVVPGPGMEAELPRLAEIISAPQGLPLRPEDLPPVGDPARPHEAR